MHADPTRAVAQRLAAARGIAALSGAALAALYAVTPSFVELPYAPELGPSVAADLVRIDEERRERTRKVFDDAMKGPGPLATWSQSNDLPTIGAFAQQALYADLLVLGQDDRTDDAAATVPPDFVASVLSASGRPAVIVPHIGAGTSIGETIAIAWKPTPEAARAVSSAMPLLQRASAVHVLTWGDAGVPDIAGPLLDLDAYLGRHGVQATWHHGGLEPEAVGELLLSRAFDIGADLLVMGCYGHGRAREWILGGASRTVLASMTLPVLMAH